MTVNGHRLRSVSAVEAGRMPDGTVLIQERVWRDARTWEVTRRAFYRVTIERRRTVGGEDVAVRWAPDSDWPEMPTWQGDWIWLSGGGLSEGYFVEVEG